MGVKFAGLILDKPTRDLCPDIAARCACHLLTWANEIDESARSSARLEHLPRARMKLLQDEREAQASIGEGHEL